MNMADFEPLFNDEDFAVDDEDDDMAKKKKQETEYALNPDIVAAAKTVSAGYDAGKKAVGAVKGFLFPGKQEQVAKLKAEVQELEAKKALDKELKELRDKKAALQASEEKEADEYAYA